MSSEKLGPDPVAFVNRQRTPVAGHEFGAAASGGRRDQRVICCAASHLVVRQPEDEILVSRRTQSQERLPKPRLQEIADERAGSAVGRRQPGKDGIGLQRAVLD